MRAAQTGGPDYDARIRRAGHLAAAYPFAAEVLAFYVRLATFQRDFYGKIRGSGGVPGIMAAEGQLRSELKLGDLLGQFPEFLALLGNAGPTPVAEAARAFGEQSPDQWMQLLTDFWTFGGRADSETEIENSGAEPLEEFVLRAFLQPHAEFLGARISDSPLASSPCVCPCCGSAPLLGVLRPEGDG